MGRHKKMALTLKKETVYSVSGFFCLLCAVFLVLSFFDRSGSLGGVQDGLTSFFGGLVILAPLGLVVLGFYLFHIKKFFLSQTHVIVGYGLVFLSLLGLFRGGSIGMSLSDVVSEVLGLAGANLIYFVGLCIGLVVLFDKSIDEMFGILLAILKAFGKLVPGFLTGMFKSKKVLVKEHGKQTVMTIGNQKDSIPSLNSLPAKEPVINKGKEIKAEMQPGLKIADQLVNNAGVGVWEYPPLELLSDMPGQKADRGDIKKIAGIIEKTLASFGIEARVAEVNLGPAVTQYALEIALGTKVSKITSLANDLALATEAPTGQIRVEAPIPGRNLIGIEIPNKSLEVVTLKTMLMSSMMQKSKSKLSVAVGLDVSGNPSVGDIAKMPHLLIAGTTGSGKSATINSFICSILFRASPQEVRFIMIDPKRVELTLYNGIPHLLTPVIVEPDQILSALKWALAEMERRYKVFAERGVRNLEAYNELSGFQAFPAIIIIIDELADLMAYAPVEVEDAIARLAQMARATGIHLIVSTQRPSVDVITGLIKANIPTRIALTVASMVDSRVILDGPGAEKLLGRGDMLYIPPNQGKPIRVQSTFVQDKEVNKLVDFLKQKNPVVQYTEEVTKQPVLIKKGTGANMASGAKAGDEQLIEDAIRVVCQYDRASASLLQRKLSLGYARAARILDQLQDLGVVGPAEGAKPRDVILRNAEEVIANLHEG